MIIALHVYAVVDWWFILCWISKALEVRFRKSFGSLACRFQNYIVTDGWTFLEEIALVLQTQNLK